MTIEEARDEVRRLARNAGTAAATLTYSHGEVDNHLRWALEEARRNTYLTRTLGTITLAASTSTFSVSATDFHAQYLIRLWIPVESGAKGGEVCAVDHGSIQHMQLADGGTAQEDCPTYVGFYGGTLGETYPTTDTGRSLLYDWRGPISTGTSWTHGSTASQTGTLTISNAFLDPILTGAAGRLIRKDPDNHAVSDRLVSEFQQWLRDNMSTGNLGATSSVRSAPED